MYTKPICTYTPKDGYGIIRIYSSASNDWVYNVKLGKYTYKFGTHCRGYSTRYDRDWRISDLSKSELSEKMNEYSYILHFTDMVDNFLEKCKLKIIEILVNIL